MYYYHPPELFCNIVGPINSVFRFSLDMELFRKPWVSLDVPRFAFQTQSLLVYLPLPSLCVVSSSNRWTPLWRTVALLSRFWFGYLTIQRLCCVQPLWKSVDTVTGHHPCTILQPKIDFFGTKVFMHLWYVLYKWPGEIYYKETYSSEIVQDFHITEWI